MFSKIIAFCFFLSVATAQEDAPAAVVVHPPTYSTALTSQTVRMTCAAYGVPKPTITWSRASGDLAAKISDPDSGFSSYTKTVTVNGTAFAVAVLEICNIRVTDTDEYSCVADNGVVTESVPIASPEAKFFLSVTGAAPEPPAVVVRPPSEVSSVYIGSTVEAVCVAYGNPLPYVSWSKDSCDDGLTCNANSKVYDEVVTYGDISFRKSVIQLCNVSMANTGSYSCWAANGVGGDGVAPNSAMWDLSVKPLPGSTSISLVPPPTTTCPSYAIPSVAPRPTNVMESPTNRTVETVVEALAVGETTYIGIIVVLVIVVAILLVATIGAIIIALRMRKNPQKADIAHGQKHPQMIAVENPIHKEQTEEQLDEQEGDTMSYSDLAKKMEAEAGDDDD